MNPYAESYLKAKKAKKKKTVISKIKTIINKKR